MGDDEGDAHSNGHVHIFEKASLPAILQCTFITGKWSKKLFLKRINLLKMLLNLVGFLFICIKFP